MVQARSQPNFSGKPEGPFCLSGTFIFRNERIWMNKSARVSEKLVSPSLPGLQVAMRLWCNSFSDFNGFFLPHVQDYIRKANIRKINKGGGHRIYNPRGLD